MNTQSERTRNPGGVRIGRVEIYRSVEALNQVVESLVVGQRWDHDVRVMLFTHLRDSVELDAAAGKTRKTPLRDNTMPRHVPAKVIEVSDPAHHHRQTGRIRCAEGDFRRASEKRAHPGQPGS